MSRPSGTTRGRASIAAVLALLVLAWAGGARAAEDPPTPAEQREAAGASSRPAMPNVVIFLVDTLRADHLGAYGYDRLPTSPRMDALAKESVVFESAYAPAPWTLPSIVSLLTSTFPGEHNVLHNRHRLGDSPEPLAARLKPLGYATINLYANPFAGPRYGLERGFDTTRSRARTQADGEAVASELDRCPTAPFFAYIHNTEPHNPYDHAPEHTEGFPDIAEETRDWFRTKSNAQRRLARVDFTRKRPLGTTDNTVEQQAVLAELTEKMPDYRDLYDAAVHMADERVGSVVDMLKARGEWDNTMFIILSDHGEEMSEHGGWLHDQSAYEELLRVPLIIRFPRGQFAGQRVLPAVSLVDVLPTIFDYLERPQHARGARGRSLMPLVRNEPAAADDDFVVPAVRMNRKKYYRPWKELRGDDNVVVRHGGWKGIWNVEPQTIELYDLSNDPGEQNDLSAENPELALAMRVFAHVWFKDCQSRASASESASEDMDEETLRNLRSLGYID